jgi:Carboxypeptidase regulatory-like domain
MVFETQVFATSTLAGSRTGARLNHHRPSILIVLLGLLGLPPGLAAQVGTHSVRGRVIDQSQNTAVAQATVTLGTDQRAMTDSNGEFEFRAVRPGSYPLVVEALGYRTVQTVVTLDGTHDVSGTIRLEPEPVPLDSLSVRLSRHTIRGRVVEGTTGRRVPFITIRQDDTNATTTNDAGGFLLRRVTRGVHTLATEGFGWLPVSVRIDVASDTTLVVEVEPDPITVQRIEDAVADITERSRSVGVALRVLGRDDIMDSKAPTPIEYLKGRGVPIRNCAGMSGRLCIGSGAAVWIDEIPTCLDVLAAYPNESFERIEVIGSRRSTIRAYTRWFVERMTRQKTLLQPITPFDKPFRC